MAELKDTQRVLRINTDEAAGSLNNLRELLKGVRQELAQQKIGSTEYQQALEAVTKAQNMLNNATRTGSAVLRDTDTVIADSNASYNELSRTLTKLKQEWKSATNEAQRSQLAGQINIVNDRLKEMDASVGVYTRKVGAYFEEGSKVVEKHIPQVQTLINAWKSGAEIFKNAGEGLKNVYNEFRGAITASEGMSAAQRTLTVATAGATAGFKALKIAIAATGIGLLVVAVGSLAAAFTRTQEGTEKFSNAMATIGAAIDVVLDRVAKIGKSIMHLFKFEWKEAWETAKASIQGLGEEIKEETQRAKELRAALTQIEKEETSLRARKAAEKVQIAELRRLANDETKAYEERIKAQEKANAIALKTAEDERKLVERRIANMLGFTSVTKEARQVLDQLARGANADEIISKLGLSESTLKDYEALVTAFEGYKRKEQEFAQLAVEGTAKANALRKAEIKSLTDMVNNVQLDEWETKANEQYEEEVARQDKISQANTKRLREEAAERLKIANSEFNSKKKLSEAELKVREQTSHNTAALLDGASKLAGENTAIGKGLAIASTTISTYQAAQQAFASQLIPGDPTSLPRAILAMSTAVVSGLANVKSILAVDTSGRSTTMGTGANRVSVSNYAPAVVQQVPLVRQLTNAAQEETLNRIAQNTSATAQNTGGGQPIKAYVVLSELEAKQNYSNRREQETTF